MNPAFKPVNQISDKTAWKSFQNLVQRFQFTESEAKVLLGDMPRSTYLRGLHQHIGKLNRDQKERISYLLGIYKSLRILFTDSAQALTWIDRPNDLPPFDGVTPRDYMLQGSIVHLADVRRFLDFWRGY